MTAPPVGAVQFMFYGGEREEPPLAMVFEDRSFWLLMGRSFSAPTFPDLAKLVGLYEGDLIALPEAFTQWDVGKDYAGAWYIKAGKPAGPINFKYWDRSA